MIIMVIFLKQKISNRLFESLIVFECIVLLFCFPSFYDLSPLLFFPPNLLLNTSPEAVLKKFESFHLCLASS